MPTPAKMEITLKIDQLPTDVQTVKHDWKQFTLEAAGQQITLTIRPKMWAKLQQAQAEWPQWVAAITGQMGGRTQKGFILLEPAVQIFERKPKPAPAEPGADTAAPEAPAAPMATAA